MLKLRQAFPHKSISRLPISELPTFSVLTGPNGIGKTHFLESLLNGAVTIEGVPKEQVRLFNFTTFAPIADDALTFNTLELERSKAWERVGNHVLQARKDLEREASRLSKGRLGTRSFESLMKITPEALLEEGFSVDEANLLSQQLSTYIAAAESKLRQGVGSSENEAAQILSLWNRSPLELDADTFYAGYPLARGTANPFQKAFTRIFLSYAQKLHENRYSKFLANSEGVSDARYLTDEQFVARFGPPPWTVLDEVLERSELPFRAVPPPVQGRNPYKAVFRHTALKGKIIGFDELSSGERILVSMALYLFHVFDGRQRLEDTKVLLLDEVDAPLHPAMTRQFIDILTDVIVSKHGRAVVLATHSPSTVALAPESSLFLMSGPERMISSTSSDEAIRALCQGLPLLSVRIENRRQVFVESHHDVRWYERLFVRSPLARTSGPTLCFVAAGGARGGGAGRVIQLVDAFVNNGNKLVRGLIDWDKHAVDGRATMVLGEGNRYAIENYLLDPLLLTALILRKKAWKFARESLGIDEALTYVSLAEISATAAQAIVDSVINRLDLSTSNPTPTKYASGLVVELPAAFRVMRGHDLAARIVDRMQPLSGYATHEAMIDEVVDTILRELPGLMPAEILATFQRLQESTI